jgi:hypothetical protein
MRRAIVLAFAAALATIGCIAPITPMERLQQSANEVASALRFERTDIAAEYVATNARDAFLSRHMFWSEKTRVVDLELVGIFLRGEGEAEAILSVMWLRTDGAMLHTTEISQRWKHEMGTYRMVDELYRRGDKALFEMLPAKEEAKKPAKEGEGNGAAKKDAAPEPPKSASTPAPPVQARVETQAIRAE